MCTLKILKNQEVQSFLATVMGTQPCQLFDGTSSANDEMIYEKASIINLMLPDQISMENAKRDALNVCSCLY